MKVDKSDWNLLNQAITEWQQSGKISGEQAGELRKDVELKHAADLHQVAQYFFFIALFCTLMAFGALFLNDKLLEKLKHYFSLSDLTIAATAAALAAAWLWYSGRRRKGLSPTVYEIYMVLGGLAALTSLTYFCKYFHIDKTYTAFLSIAMPLLAVLSAVCRSRALWIGALLATVAWFGAWSSWVGSNNLFLGMNYALRFSLLAALLLIISFVQQKFEAVSATARLTYTTGLVLLFASLWLTSIFGNYNSFAEWQQVRQIHVVAYSIIFGAASAIAFYLGIRYRDDLTRDIAVIFLLINLYTRYFEYFWDAMNKGLFFLILAVTFGFLGRWLEKKKRSMQKPAPNTAG